MMMHVLSLMAQPSVQGYEFIQNKGQWAEPFLYKAPLPGGELYLEKGRLVYTFWDVQKKTAVLDAMHHPDGEGRVTDALVNAHGLYINFLNSSAAPGITGSDAYSHYYNYFQSPDRQRWQGGVQAYRKVNYHHLYPGIDLDFYTQDRQLKYDFVLSPGAEVQHIRLQYEGAERMWIEDGRLRVKTSVNEWIEQKPFAYQLINGEKRAVTCNYRLQKNVVSFELGEYDHSLPLVIDPALIFSTYSGSQKDNWGFTATYDGQGNMYGGGIVLGGNAYPSQPGSFQLNFGGGIYDVLICKFNSTGNNLLYYTYLGGDKGEAPFSLVCNAQNELYVLGVTGSSGFPVTAGAFQTTFGGGTSVGVFALSGNDYPAGSDLFVTKLREDGTALIGSTFVGGTRNDGINGNGLLAHNYADQFRGEIIVNNNDQCYIVSSTSSLDFPLVSPAQGSLQGAQDAVVCRFNPTLTAQLFSTYLGGTGTEAGYSVQLNSSGQVYVSGGTTSSNFPTTPGAMKPAFGGQVDGFLARLSPGGNAILNATYLGTSDYDQSYAVQLDNNEDVYVVGQTTGAYPISAGVYSNPNSGQFIHKLNPSLTTTLFSTVFGRGVPGQIDIVPTAFLVDVCDHIYVAGWGGAVNAGHGGGNTQGLPVTPNAFQSTTDGSDFYLIVLDNNASGLLYGTFFGGGVSDEHVDGGTSRFDKNGIVYEAVCAGCGGHDDFPTTPGAWSNTNNSSNCNLGVFKFDVSDFTAIIDPQSPTTICVNGSVTLHNASTGGFPHVWDFGDGTTSTQQTVTHTYTQPGTYVVYLTVTAPNACVTSDQDSVIITVEEPPQLVIQVPPVLCPGTTVQLDASGGTTYQWDATPYLNNLTIPNPIANPPVTTDFYLTATNLCGSDRDTVTVTVIDFQITVSNDDTICNGSSIQLNATGGITYAWNNAASLNNPNIQNPVATPTVTTNYIVTVTDANGCTLTDTVRIQVDNFPNANAGPDHTICEGDAQQLNGSGGTSYSWSPNLYLSNASIANPIATPAQTISYVLGATNTCGTDYDTVRITVISVHPNGSPDTTICPGTSVMLWASGGSSYAWSPANLVDQPANDTANTAPTVPTEYIVQITDTNGCSTNDTIFVNLFPEQIIDLGPDVLIPFGHNHQLFANGNGTYTWTPDSFLTCTDCPNPVVVQPTHSMTYTLIVTDANGCQFSDSINIFVEGTLYVPNTFTPNRDNINTIFRAYGVDIATFTMRIFNRWGEEIFVTEVLTNGWDGTYRGSPCPLGVYVWKIDYTEVSGKEGKLIGHVNLLR